MNYYKLRKLVPFQSLLTLTSEILAFCHLCVFLSDKALTSLLAVELKSDWRLYNRVSLSLGCQQVCLDSDHGLLLDCLANGPARGLTVFNLLLNRGLLRFQ